MGIELRTPTTTTGRRSATSMAGRSGPRTRSRRSSGSVRCTTWVGSGWWSTESRSSASPGRQRTRRHASRSPCGADGRRHVGRRRCDPSSSGCDAPSDRCRPRRHRCEGRAARHAVRVGRWHLRPCRLRDRDDDPITSISPKLTKMRDRFCPSRHGPLPRRRRDRSHPERSGIGFGSFGRARSASRPAISSTSPSTAPPSKTGSRRSPTSLTVTATPRTARRWSGTTVTRPTRSR